MGLENRRIVSTMRDAKGFSFSTQMAGDDGGGGGPVYPEPFDVKEITVDAVTLQYPEFIVGEVIYYGAEAEYTASLAAGILYVKLDTQDWSIVEIATIAANQYATLDTADGRYTYKPLYLIDADLAIVRNYRNAALPRWA
jgi:hypothetical protein